MAKDTLYIEADDEITAVIDKVSSAKSKVVAIVLPKRATVFQSAVNMKLLKKAAENAKKNLVLITSEESIESIAAVAGLHIAKTLNSKPEIPKKKPSLKAAETTITPDDMSSSATSKAEEPLESAASVGSDTIKLDNTDKADEESPVSPKKAKGSGKFKIPDFTSFRFRLVLGASIIVLLLVGWILGFKVLPKATITLDTDTSRMDISSEFVANTAVASTDVEEKTVAAEKVEVSKENSATVPATGEKDVGEKATGTMTLTNCRKSDEGVTIPAGTSFTAGSYSFVTLTSVKLSPAVYAGSNCISGDFPGFGAVKDAGVQATEPGEGYNIEARAYDSSVSGVTAEGTDMTGGTTEVATVVSAEDIQKAENQLAGSATAEATDELRKLLDEKQLQPLNETLQEADAQVTRSAAEDDEATEVTIKKSVVYSMLGVATEDLSSLLDAKVRSNLEDAGQNIRNNGLDNAVYALAEKISDTEHRLSIRTVATVGPEFDEESIKQEIMGKERGEIEKLLGAREGVRSVTVEYSPFWVFQVPASPSKITIVINEEG